MSRSPYRKKQSQSAQQHKRSVTEQTLSSPKKKPIQKTAAASTSPAVMQSVVPLKVDDHLLREFLLAADVHAQQTFLAQVAVCAMKEAQSHAFAPLQDLRKQHAAMLEQHQQDQQLLIQHQAQHQQLLAEHVKLQKQFAQQKMSMQQISDQYKALATKKAEPAVKPKPETILKKNIKSEQDAVWTDPATGLMWSRISIGQVWSNGKATGEAKKLSWKAAGEACAAFELAGFSDWRLPEKTELESLMRRKVPTIGFTSSIWSRAMMLGSIADVLQAGYNTSAGALLLPKENEFGTFWSKTELSATEVLVVSFDHAQELSRGKMSSLYVRAVRKAI